MSTENPQIEPEEQENKIHDNPNPITATQPKNEKDQITKEQQPIVSTTLTSKAIDKDESGKSNQDHASLSNAKQEDPKNENSTKSHDQNNDNPVPQKENDTEKEPKKTKQEKDDKISDKDTNQTHKQKKSIIDKENQKEKDGNLTDKNTKETQNQEDPPKSSQESDNQNGNFREGMINLVASVDKEKPEHSQTLNKEEKSASEDKPNDSNKLNSKRTAEKANEKIEDQTSNKNTAEKPVEKIADEKLTEKSDSQQALADAFATIGKFFSVTTENLAKQSSDTVDKITEAFMKSNLVSACLQKNEDLNYSAIITSDLQAEVQHQKPRTKKLTEQQQQQRQQQQSFALSSDSKLLKNLKSETSNPDQSTLRESNMIVRSNNPKTSFSQSKERPKNDYEEQIRQHKIQEIMKMKKNLEAKLSSLNEQLVELQKSEQSPSPVRTQPKKRETKDEIFERQRQAKEFAKKMNLERKALEIRSEKRREARQVQVTKEIDVLQQNRVKNTEVLKVIKTVNKSIDPTSRMSKAAQARSALEERKQDLKAKREFDKNLEGSPDVSQSQEKKPRSKIPTKSYKSPMLPQVLAQDAELKRAENEKITKRKTLHEKQVEYAKEVKESFLPKLKSKYEARKLKMGVYKSHNVETYLEKVAKERLFENPLKQNAYAFKKTPVKSKDISRNSTHTNDEGISHQKNAKVDRSRYEDDDDFSERTSAKRVNPQLQENFMFGEAAHSNKSQSYVHSQGDSPVGSHNLDMGLQGKKIRDKVLGVHSSQISEPNTIHSSHRTPNKRSSLVKGYGESETWKEELQQDQAELKKKISGMLEDIKKMEDHVKNKEEKISKDIEAIQAK